MTWFEKLTAAALLVLLAMVAAGGFAIYSVKPAAEVGSTNTALGESKSQEHVREVAAVPIGSETQFSNSILKQQSVGKSVGPFGVIDSDDSVQVEGDDSEGAERDQVFVDNEESPWLPKGVTDVAEALGKSNSNFDVNNNNKPNVSNDLSGSTELNSYLPSIEELPVDVNGNLIPPISGLIVDDKDQPVADYMITLSMAYAINKDKPIVTRSDGNGRFRFLVVSKGEYILKTEIHPFFNTLTRRVRAGASDIKFRLSRLDSARITGRVIDEFDQPVVGAEIVPPIVDEVFLSNEDGILDAPITATAGQGLLLRVTANGFLPETLFFPGGSWLPSEPIVAEARLRRGSFELTGVVYDQQGYSVPSALVQVTSRNARLHRSTQTDEDGRFTIDKALPATDYHLKITAGIRYEAYELKNMSFNSGMDELQIPLPYSPIGGLSGRVIDESGSPVESLSMMVMSDGAGGRAATITTDVEGRYSLSNFVAGEISLRSRTAPTIVIENLNIEPGLDTSQDLVVDLGSNTLMGLVTSEDGLPVEGAKLNMRYYRQDPNGYKTTVKRTTITDAEGGFQFASLGSGERVVKIDAEGFRQATIKSDPALDPGPHTWILNR